MRRPILRVLRTRYPDLAGVLLRDWARDGCLTTYRYHPEQGFWLVAVRPRWRWLSRFLLWLWRGSAR